MIYTNYISKYVEEINYKTGITGECYNYTDIFNRIGADTLQEFLEILIVKFDITKNDIYEDRDYNNASVLSICRLELKNGFKASEVEIEKYKNGEINLYDASYKFQIHSGHPLMLDKSIDQYLNGELF